MRRLWASIFPPNGFNCRCRVIALSEAAVKRRGLTVVSSQVRLFTQTVQVGTNKRTEEVRNATVSGIRLKDSQGRAITFRTDPGFNHAPGTGLAEALKRKQAISAQEA